MKAQGGYGDTETRWLDVNGGNDDAVRRAGLAGAAGE
jgi:hypothetical protein